MYGVCEEKPYLLVVIFSKHHSIKKIIEINVLQISNTKDMILFWSKCYALYYGFLFSIPVSLSLEEEDTNEELKATIKQKSRKN